MIAERTEYGDDCSLRITKVASPATTMVYTETKPRGPIFIDFAGPGPAYALPSLMGNDSHDPRSHHSRGPSYSMAGRWKERKTDNSGPGPIYKPDDNLFRTGRDEGKSISLKGRYKERSNISTAPGPGTYNPNTTSLSENKAGPSYSMAGRHSQRKRKDETPGPNAYVPSFGNREGKGCSLKGRYKDTKKEDNSPGPTDYKPGSGLNRYGPKTAPEVSLKGRNYAKRDTESAAPGPGAYHPQTTSLSSSKSLPAWSLSSRHKEPNQKDNTPGPNTYLPLRPSETSSAPAYSMKGKYKPRNTADDSPGPAVYNPDPKYGVKGRHEEKAASLKGRYRDRSKEKEDTPGPGIYNVLGSPRESGPAYSMTGKPRTLEKIDDTPGPNTYNPAFIDKSAPSYTLKGRHNELDQKDSGPGPGAYGVPEKKETAPAYSITGKWLDEGAGNKKGEHSPGPATYNPDESIPKTDRGLSFGVRHSRAKWEGPMKKL